MSYILDALRRADSERERGAVPGVHAQPVPLGAADAVRPPASRRWAGVSVVLATLLLVLLAWPWIGREAAPEVTPSPQAVAPPPPGLPAPGWPAPTGGAAAAPIVEAAPAAVATLPELPARPRNAAPTPVKAKGGAGAAAPAASARTAVAVAPPASAATRVPTANELPDDIQRGLPTLVVGGASYSQNADSRMLILNGQVFREGDKVAPEVSLEQIRLKEAVLATKGHRYRIVY